MNVLLIGAGGREHALTWAISTSPLLTKLYCAPGNAGMGQLAECVPIRPMDFDVIIRFCREKSIDFVVIGPDDPVVAGLADELAAAGIKAFGPSKAAAQLEGRAENQEPGRQSSEEQIDRHLPPPHVQRRIDHRVLARGGHLDEPVLDGVLHVDLTHVRKKTCGSQPLSGWLTL